MSKKKKDREVVFKPKVWFTSDQHFDHEKILELEPGRSARDIDEMNDRLVDRWNKFVSDDDLVIHVGDFCLGCTPGRIRVILQRLAFKMMIMVRGNHDRGPSTINQIDSRVWQFPYLVTDFAPHEELKSALVLHEPMATNIGGLIIHGHIHNAKTGEPRKIWRSELGQLHFHVGVDAWRGRPVEAAEINGLVRRFKEDEKAALDAAVVNTLNPMITKTTE